MAGDAEEVMAHSVQLFSPALIPAWRNSFEAAR